MLMETLTVQETIGRRLRAQRALAGMSQTEVAQATGILQREISRLENGGWHALNPTTFCKLADLFGCSLDELAGREVTHERLR